MIKNDFLKMAEDSSISFLSEAKLIELLQKFDKAIILSSDSLIHIQTVYSKMKKEIEIQKASLMIHYHVDPDCTFSQKEVAKSSIPETNVLNILNDLFGYKYMGFVFVVYNGFRCLIHNGRYSNEVNACLMRRESMNEQLNVLNPVSKLLSVFGYFLVDCEQGKYYAECFGQDRKVKSDIYEQDLRNLLYRYLREKMKGLVQPEYCTSIFNDEESVDIHIYDGNESALVEVKFAFSKDYYAGKTFYCLKDRARKGYEQLNRYAMHLEKDSRRTEYGHMYIFHMLDRTEEQVYSDVNDVFNSMDNELSPEFYTIYHGTQYNNMHKWKVS